MDGSILPELCQHPLAAHQLFTVSYVQKEGAELIHVEVEGRGEAGVFPPLFERNAVISIASSPRDASMAASMAATKSMKEIINPPAAYAGSKRKTPYQKTHRVLRCEQVKCLGKTDGERCTGCGVYIKRNVAHLPRLIGSLGYLLHYADGSTFFQANPYG